MRRALIAVCLGSSLCLTGSALGAPLGYPWVLASESPHEPLEHRFAPPEGWRRVTLVRNSWGAWLRDLPLEQAGMKVHLFDGKEKARQDVHVAVVALDVGTRDLQQCADAVMRLRTEYLYARGLPVIFHPDPKKPQQEIVFNSRLPDPDRKRIEKYLVLLFSEAGSASLQAEMPKATGPAQPGDVLIQGGYPGHAVLVLDAVEGPDGRRKLMLGQSYMPAQQFHVLKAPDGSPWFDEAALDAKTGLKTPEWRPFFRKDVRRFSSLP